MEGRNKRSMMTPKWGWDGGKGRRRRKRRWREGGREGGWQEEEEEEGFSSPPVFNRWTDAVLPPHFDS